MLDHNLTGDDEFFGRLQKLDDSNRITVDIALPADPVLGADVQPGRLYADIVTLARPQVQGMRQQCDRLGVLVACQMLDLDMAHIPDSRAPA